MSQRVETYPIMLQRVEMFYQWIQKQKTRKEWNKEKMTKDTEFSIRRKTPPKQLDKATRNRVRSFSRQWLIRYAWRTRTRMQRHSNAGTRVYTRTNAGVNGWLWVGVPSKGKREKEVVMGHRKVLPSHWREDATPFSG